MLINHTDDGRLLVADGEYDISPKSFVFSDVEKDLINLKQAVHALNHIISKMDEATIDLFEEGIYHFYKLGADEGYSHDLTLLENEIDNFYNEIFNAKDEMPKKEDFWDLIDEGFHRDYGFDKNLFSKLIEDSEEKEVSEIVYFHSDGTYSYRRCTVYWQKEDHGRTSSKIVYDNLPISPEFEIYIRNTQRGL